MNTKLHAITDSIGRPIRLFITAGQVSDYIGARALCGALPTVEWQTLKRRRKVRRLDRFGTRATGR